MIRVTVELLPGGNESRKRTLGTMEIANDGTGDQAIGNYNGLLYAEYTVSAGRPGRVTGFNRRRQSVWSLVGEFLKLWGHIRHSPAKMSLDLPSAEECECGGMIGLALLAGADENEESEI